MINPLGFIITILYFKIAERLRSLSLLKNIPPIAIAGVMLIATFEIFHLDFEVYNESASYLTLCLVPATIALGFPIYKHFELLKKNKRVVYFAFVIATLTALIGTYIIAKLCHSELSVIESMLPKSVTAPIAVEISKLSGGIPELTACVVVLTGVFGGMFGHKILGLIPVKNDIAIGLSIGAASHVVGTAKCVEIQKEKQVVMASVALVIVGIMTTIIVPIFLHVFKLL
ncbi:MAG: LrgB family protein [Muribaculaceae bacterium]|nr:LrgB family protein [Muribaculaceae bacterium]